MRIASIIITTYMIAAVAILTGTVVMHTLSPKVQDPRQLRLIISFILLFIGFYARRIAEKCLGLSLKEELNRKKDPPSSSL